MWLLKLVITLILATQLSALCDVCQSANNVACHNETAYSICMFGLPTNNFVQCPPNTYCTDDTYTCIKGDPVCKSGEDSITETTPADFSSTDEPTSTTEELTSTTEESSSTTEESTTEDLTSTTAEPIIPTTTPKPTTTSTTTTTTTPEPSTTTAAAWDAEASCAAVTKVTLFKNEDDPTCTT
ncbi:uncharacterized protein Dwil_GK13193 [Drosophila willistoni]|uniref:Chitin-binding type-2 domain-containing protein n=1 Tax=Drosophila willistoni TaxID=7260 RepID=B4N3R5_DROWI|nr:uncharacterized protein Dwil_GK13193 [Drosophila willistoni]